MTGANETDEADGFYYNIRTNMVEHGRLSPWEHLMGPYETQEEAEKAFEIAQARNVEWDEDDQEWDEIVGEEEDSH